eukprot:708287-Prymnesium_polylepis.1
MEVASTPQTRDTGRRATRSANRSMTKRETTRTMRTRGNREDPACALRCAAAPTGHGCCGDGRTVCSGPACAGRIADTAFPSGHHIVAGSGTTACRATMATQDLNLLQGTRMNLPIVPTCRRPP